MTQRPPDSAPPRPSISAARLRPADAAIVLFAGVVLMIFRLHAFRSPLESDECNYAYIAQRLLHGDRLYLDVWDHQPPGIFAFLTLATTAFGGSPTVHRTLALVACVCTLGLIFDITRRWFGRLGAATAALLFALASSDPGTAGEGCNREIYMNTLAVAAIWILARGLGGPESDRGRCAPPEVGAGRPAAAPRGVFLAGVLLGLASMLKTVAAAQWLTLAGALAVTRAAAARASPLGPESGRQATAKALLAFALGPVLIWLTVGAYFAATARGAEFIDAVFSYNLVYADGSSAHTNRWLGFFDKSRVFLTAPALWLGGAAGLAALPWKRSFPQALMLAALMAGSFVAVCLPGQFWPHYYYLMFPCLAISAGGLVHRAAARHRAIGAVSAALMIGWLSISQTNGYLRVAPDHIAWGRYKDRMAWVRDQAAKVAGVTRPTDSIYVWSADAGYYYYSGRRCASRYTMFGALTSRHDSTAARRRLLIEDLSNAQPRLILIPAVAQTPCPELLAFIQERRYVSVGKDNRGMEVLCDLERPIQPIEWSWQAGE